tara:strand:+ start:3701 stop:4864 length:1164 start_codon:yes stop_codon:yes gene_type:complete
MRKITEIAIIGSGIIGMTCALVLSNIKNIKVTLYGKTTYPSPYKTTAILKTSFDIYQKLGLLNETNDEITKLTEFIIMDQTSGNNRLLNFKSKELNLDCFAYNIRDIDLCRILNDKIQEKENIQLNKEFVTHIQNDINEILVKTKNTEESYKLIVGADGKNSISRKFAKIHAKKILHNELILITSIKHTGHHNNISYEFHRKGNLVTSVPLSKKESAIIIIDNKKNIKNYTDLVILKEYLSGVFNKYLGLIETVNDIKILESEKLTVNKLSNNRTILVGESAHAFPPLGAQGLNLGLRDILSLHKIINSDTEDPGRKVQINKYHLSRWDDIYSKSKSVDLLYKSMMENKKIYQLIRKVGYFGLNKSQRIRRYLLSQGMAINSDTLDI